MPGNPVVHIIDDDDAIRDSLVFLLTSADIKVVAYASADEFMRALPGVTTGCVVTDIRMPGMGGIDLLRHLKEIGSSLQVIVMTGHGDVPLAVEAMRLGAADFIEKPFDDEVFITSVRTAIANQMQSEEDVALRSEVQKRIESLSTRERQVLEGLVAGHANKRIAYDLGISP
ncbi:MAG TPA: response regulator, partial [Bauldia sp.]|nr:response regulator [Bauldia sp.]